MKIVVSCVAEDTDTWADRVWMLAFSIRKFGGSLAEVPFVANFVDSARSAQGVNLESLDVTVRTVPRVDPECPWANKLRMLEMPEALSSDVLLALDCDIVVMGDVSTMLPDNAVGGVPECMSALTENQWKILHERVGAPYTILPAPAGGFTSRSYVNSGVLSIPGSICANLRKLWEESLQDLYAAFSERPRIAKKRNFADQIALSIAIDTGQLDLTLLPDSLNCHTGGFPESFAPQLQPPFILHYHGHRDEAGFLKRSGSGEIDTQIHAFNLARAQALRLSYSRPERRSLKVWMGKSSPMTRKALVNASRLKHSMSHRSD